MIESSQRLAEAAREQRPELADERHAARWVRRRLGPVRAALMALVTLLPELSGCVPRLSDYHVDLRAEPRRVPLG